MQIASTIVQIVHDLTRDALTQLAGTAISAATTAATTAAATLGFDTPWAIAQVTTRVAPLSARVGKYVTKLLKAIKELLPRLDDAARLFRSLRKVRASGSNAIRIATRHGDDAAAALPIPSPAIRAPHAPALTRDETFEELVMLDRAHVPGTVPTYRGDVDTVVSYFDGAVRDVILGTDARP